MKLLGYIILTLTLALTGCGTLSNGNDAAPKSNRTDLSYVQTTERDAAKAILLAIKQKDIATLTSFIHPEKGLLLSPYAHIEPNVLRFQRDELPSLESSTLYTWGLYDGSGEPIKLTFHDYYKQFVYNKPFYESEQIGYNEIIGHGSIVSNIEELFPSSTIIDYHLSGFDPQYEGLDWQSLILVIESYNDFWYVSAIIHSQWTI